MKRRTGFTLIELLVVIAVIAVLMGVLLPALQKAKKQASATVCLANIHGVMLAVNTYSQTYDDRLPRSGRSWPHEGTLDYPTLLAGDGLDPSRLHCPGDVDKPGAIAVWWKSTLGREIQSSDYLDGYKPEDLGIKANNDFSYLWSAKLFLKCDSPKNPPAQGWKVGEIRYPSKLILYMHFWSLIDYAAGRGVLPHGKIGHYAGFLDGHSEYVGLQDMTQRVEPIKSNLLRDLAPYQEGFSDRELNILARWNPDWNKDGVKGRDME